MWGQDLFLNLTLFLFLSREELRLQKERETQGSNLAVYGQSTPMLGPIPPPPSTVCDRADSQPLGFHGVKQLPSPALSLSGMV